MHQDRAHSYRGLRFLPLVRAAVFALPVVFQIGCATTAEKLDREATRLNLERRVVLGQEYRHLVYSRFASGKRLYVFIEGDGVPWINQRVIAADPTPMTAIAFNLMIESHGPAVYLGRPCYFGLQDPTCRARDWTHGRFSEKVVGSMHAAISALIQDAPQDTVVLIGYSGGAALAMLLASRLPEVEAVITVAGLLDTDAWTDYHDYEALSGSLNPAQTVIPENIRQLHLVGELDSVIPAAASLETAARWPAAEVWTYPDFDHACCWEKRWPEIFARILRSL